MGNGNHSAGAGRGADGGQDARRRTVRRRSVLIGAGVAAATGGVLARDQLGRLWYQVPGVSKPRVEGAVDYAKAEWVAASDANWRRADRPDDFTVDRVIIHVVQGSYAVALKVFQDPAHRAATHYVVGKDGRVAQLIRELDVAYQAGNREYNERAVGIEHEGFVDRPQDFTGAMYESSARLTADICLRHGIPVDRTHVIGHVEVPGTDHTDPGPHWDWDRYLRLVRAAKKQLERERKQDERRERA
ncbi:MULTISPECIES: N-acetylmuramoyl-L-alanine amidase [Streptomyces]|uniref:N-acetylmuramoyl-L-alanine amidase n=1 Tax=Streptomyces fungicidicus TaxID=68203 RepID=A0ACC7XVI7_9ACTN|nr:MULTISPECIES: peptidoglycan recognition family protein [Streptomyces]MBF4133795.1 N-acetylmuramoyl-L-alanine amidase [Streptomyces albidoflavus]NUV73590.1 N-acetylmuramoyl-L-alanine amidase [Streptomyces fungicidicus]PAX85479.1 N-acetylmuramoyl-L-alanine amidase [Streptomyces albidoflavus]PAX89518.1 N-acetylmuramoyl-L-alanine amidase [Streptomyces albidoflavus]PBO18755.1 N-acetylmuramoyl-L-alanine amidase [Streptomyces albidoflavus]